MEKTETIHNDAAYEAALARISELMDVLSGPEGQETDGIHPDRIELDLLVARVELYEDKHYPIDPSSAIGAFQLYIDQIGLINKNLIGPIGNQTRVSEGSSERWDWSLSLHPAMGPAMRRITTSRARISPAA